MVMILSKEKRNIGLLLTKVAVEFNKIEFTSKISSGKIKEPPLEEVFPRRYNAILSRIELGSSPLLDCESTLRLMFRNCIISTMKAENNLLAYRFLHTMDRRSSPWMPIMSAKVKRKFE